MPRQRRSCIKQRDRPIRHRQQQRGHRRAVVRTGSRAGGPVGLHRRRRRPARSRAQIERYNGSRHAGTKQRSIACATHSTARPELTRRRSFAPSQRLTVCAFSLHLRLVRVKGFEGRIVTTCQVIGDSGWVQQRCRRLCQYSGGYCLGRLGSSLIGRSIDSSSSHAEKGAAGGVSSRSNDRARSPRAKSRSRSA